MEKGKIIRPRTMTLEEMEADVKATEAQAIADEAARKESIPVETKETSKAAEPEKVEPVTEVTPSPTKEEAVIPNDSWKANKAELEARIDILTKRLRDEDGSRGGKMAELQENMTRLGEQLRQVMEENRTLRTQKPVEPTPAEEPDTLSEQYPDLAKGMERRAKPAMDAAAEARAMAKKAQETTDSLIKDRQQEKYDNFLNTIKQSVPAFDKHNNDPAFLEWCNGYDEGSAFDRQSTLDQCRRTMSAAPVIQLFQKWEKMKTSVQATEPERGPAKPSKEAQVEVPRSGAGVAKAKPAVDPSKRLKEIEDKVFRFGTATAEDRLEYDRLLDASEREGKT